MSTTLDQLGGVVLNISYEWHYKTCHTDQEKVMSNSYQ